MSLEIDGSLRQLERDFQRGWWAGRDGIGWIQKDGVGRIRDGERTVPNAQTNTPQKQVDAQGRGRTKELAGSGLGKRERAGTIWDLVRTKSKCRQRLLAACEHVQCAFHQRESL
jgi:hypothetical protein